MSSRAPVAGEADDVVAAVDLVGAGGVKRLGLGRSGTRRRVAEVEEEEVEEDGEDAERGGGNGMGERDRFHGGAAKEEEEREMDRGRRLLSFHLAGNQRLGITEALGDFG